MKLYSFLLLLWKNFKVLLKRYKLLSLEIFICLTCGLFGLILRLPDSVTTYGNATVWIHSFQITENSSHLDYSSPYAQFSGLIAYAPKNSITDQIMSKTHLRLGVETMGKSQRSVEKLLMLLVLIII